MEPATKPITMYTILTYVSRVEQRIESVYIGGVGADAAFTKHSTGWYLSIEGSHEAIYIGKEQPELKYGDKIKISIKRIDP